MHLVDRSGKILLNIPGNTLYEADLGGANLRGANLRGADLRGANLGDADLGEANLGGADLGGADLRGALQSLGLTVDPTLPQRILDQIRSDPASWDQEHWHSVCGTKHCVAGWACELSGPLGHYLDMNLGTSTAATLLLWHPTSVASDVAASLV